MPRKTVLGGISERPHLHFLLGPVLGHGTWLNLIAMLYSHEMQPLSTLQPLDSGITFRTPTLHPQPVRADVCQPSRPSKAEKGTGKCAMFYGIPTETH